MLSGEKALKSSHYYYLTFLRFGKAESNADRSSICQRCLSSVSVTTSETAEHPAAIQPSSDDQFMALSEKKKTTKIPLNIPKVAGITAAAALADIIERALSGDDKPCERLTSFATVALSTSSSSNQQSRQSITAAIKTNFGQLSDRLTSIVDDRTVLPKDTSRPSPCATDFRKMINSKLLVEYVAAIIRIIASDDSVITPTAEVVSTLRLRHHQSPLDLRSPSQTLSVSEKEVMFALKLFPPSSAGGVDELRPGHLKDLDAPRIFEAGRCLLNALANLCSKHLRCQLPQHASDLLYAINSTARRKDGGIVQSPSVTYSVD